MGLFKKKKVIPVEIRRYGDKNKGHNHIIVDSIDNKNVSVGLTSQKTKGQKSTNKNKRLEMDPLGTNKTSYVRRQATIDSKKKYGNKKTGNVTPNDYATIKNYGDRAKERYKNKKK